MKLRRDVSHGHRLARVALCGVLVSGLLSAGAATAATDCETVWVRTYNVSMEVDRKVYRVGDTAKVDATVTRIDTGSPVAGASFVALVFYEDALLMDVEKTDSAGRATAELKLKRKAVELGPATLHGIAYDEVADATCARLVEYGEQKIRKAFVVKQ